MKEQMYQMENIQSKRKKSVKWKNNLFIPFIQYANVFSQRTKQISVMKR